MTILSTILRQTFLFGGTALSLYGICEYQAYEARQNYKKALATRDQTRQQYGSFGMNWGYQADDIVLSQIDSGDMLMFDMTCSTYTDTITQYQHILKGNVAIAYRDQNGVKLLTNMYNKTKVIDYPELLLHPGLHFLAIKKVDDFSVKDHKQLGQIISQKQQKATKEKSYELLNETFKRLGYLKTPLKQLQNEDDIINNISKKFGSSINVRTEYSKQK